MRIGFETMFHTQWKVQILAQSVSVGDSLKVIAAKNPLGDDVTDFALNTKPNMFYDYSYLTAKSKFPLLFLCCLNMHINMDSYLKNYSG